MASKESSLPPSGDERRKWFDDVELDDSMELSSLSLHMSDISIKVPDSSSSDADLRALVSCANKPPTNPKDQKKSLDLLEAYLERVKQKESEKKKEADDKARNDEERRKERHAKRGTIYTKVAGAMRALAPSIKNVFDFVLKVLHGGMKAVEATVFIASELTFQTHYEVALKAVLLFITAYESAGELTKSVVDMFNKIDEYELEMKALKENIRSVSMSKAINKLFVSIVAFIVAAGSYMKHGTLTKMVKFLGGGNDKFEGLIKAIRDDYAEVFRVMSFAQVMINLSSHDKINSVGDNTTKIVRQLSLLNDSFTPDMSKQLRVLYDHSTFQAELHVQNLRSELFDGPYEPSEEMAFNHNEQVFLSPQDRWPRHLRGFGAYAAPESAVAKHPAAASKLNNQANYPLMWISGNIARRNVSWVSSFCVDLITHFREFSNFDTAYIFCKRGRGQRYTPTLLLKGLAVQLLEAHPSVATRNLRRLSKDRFCEIGTEVKSNSGHLAWQLLEDVIRLIETAPEFQGRVAMLLIDRLDLCVSEDGFSVLEDLIPRLQGISHRVSRVRVLITTARLSPLGVPTLRRGSEWLRAYGKQNNG